MGGGGGGDGDREIEKTCDYTAYWKYSVPYSGLSSEILEALPDLTKGSFVALILLQSFEVVKALSCQFWPRTFVLCRIVSLED